MMTDSLTFMCNTQACITSIAAATMAAEKILAGSAMATLVGGCETFSDVPIRFRCAPFARRVFEIPYIPHSFLWFLCSNHYLIVYSFLILSNERFSRPIRQRLLELPKTLSKKGPLGALKLLRGLKIKDLVPETPAIANYTTGVVCTLTHIWITGVKRPTLTCLN